MKCDLVWEDKSPQSSQISMMQLTYLTNLGSSYFSYTASQAQRNQISDSVMVRTLPLGSDRFRLYHISRMIAKCILYFSFTIYKMGIMTSHLIRNLIMLWRIQLDSVIQNMWTLPIVIEEERVTGIQDFRLCLASYYSNFILWLGKPDNRIGMSYYNRFLLKFSMWLMFDSLT